MQEQRGSFITKNKRLKFFGWDDLFILCWKDVKVLNLIQNFSQISMMMIQEISSRFLI